MPELPTGTVTLLFSDIEGSTRLLKALSDEYGRLLADHQQLLRAAFHEADGHEIDTQGDAFFVAFARAKDAIAAALAAQRSLAGHSWPDGEEVRVRMGIHTAEPTFGGERYVGLGVHRAARMLLRGPRRPDPCFRGQPESSSRRSFRTVSSCWTSESII